MDHYGLIELAKHLVVGVVSVVEKFYAILSCMDMGEEVLEVNVKGYRVGISPRNIARELHITLGDMDRCWYLERVKKLKRHPYRRPTLGIQHDEYCWKLFCGANEWWHYRTSKTLHRSVLKVVANVWLNFLSGQLCHGNHLGCR